jgi:uncharacterized membrane protein YkvA (DUF1232 family)
VAATKFLPFLLAKLTTRRNLGQNLEVRLARRAGGEEAKSRRRRIGYPVGRLCAISMTPDGIADHVGRALRSFLASGHSTVFCLRYDSRMASKLMDWARATKRDVHAIYLAARDPRVPWYAKALALCVARYALSPIDLIPDFIPVIGYLDDLVIVPLGILAVVKLIPPEIMAEHRAAAAIASERPISHAAATVIVLIWIVSMALVGWLGYRFWAGRNSN